MESYFKGKPQAQYPDFVSAVQDGKRVIFGDRELYIDPDKPIYENRYQLILNAVDWLLERNDMINIRSRHLQNSILDIEEYMHKNNLL